MSEITSFKTSWVKGKLYKMVPDSKEVQPLFSPTQMSCIGQIDKETANFSGIHINFKLTDAVHNLTFGEVFMFIDNEFVWEQRHELIPGDDGSPMPGGPSFTKAVIKSIEYIQILIGDKLCVYCAGALHNVNFGEVKFIEVDKKQ